ncbi:hypothetical protein Daus18300_008352 [Diaporthe australafricana]|uniref:Uncharacterized protein n=1 Tax=Diaporthe australafricana TaxID=127596 RepID=A0ABR3WIP7_9PEZI
MDSNDNGGQNGGSSKKRALDESPRKHSPAKKPKTEHKDKTKIEDEFGKIRDLIAKLEAAHHNANTEIRQKQNEDKKFMRSQLSKKVDTEAAMDTDEHEKLITKSSKMATRAYLRDILHDKVEDIVNDMLDERDAVIMGHIHEQGRQIHEQGDQEQGSQIRAHGRQLREQSGQILAILQWIRDI